MKPNTIASPLSPDQWPPRERALAEELQLIFVPLTTKVVCGRNGLVATTTSPIAAHAGVEALRAGGTAADAAAAVALTQPAMALGSYVSYAGIMQALYYDAVA